VGQVQGRDEVRTSNYGRADRNIIKGSFLDTLENLLRSSLVLVSCD